MKKVSLVSVGVVGAIIVALFFVFRKGKANGNTNDAQSDDANQVFILGGGKVADSTYGKLPGQSTRDWIIDRNKNNWNFNTDLFSNKKKSPFILY